MKLFVGFLSNIIGGNMKKYKPPQIKSNQDGEPIIIVMTCYKPRANKKK